MQSRIESDLKSAMKQGDRRRVSTLRLLLAALKNEQIQARRELAAEEVEAVLRRGVKQRKDSIEQYERGGRRDLAEAEREELAILDSYLPQGLSEEELRAAIQAILDEKRLSSPQDVGKVMKDLMARHRGRVDGKRAQELVRQMLGG
jgi:hypothetical protein